MTGTADASGGRVLVKLSGEAMAGGRRDEPGRGINPADLRRTAGELVAAADATGVGLVVIPGGGNIVRGAALAEAGLLSRDAADQMGMLGTVVNAIALREAIVHAGRPAEVRSALAVPPIAPAFERREADGLLAGGAVVIVAAGVGQPYFSTDSGAALRAAQLGCRLIVKATKVDGVYSADPARDAEAERFERLTIGEAIERRLGVMDLSALTLCRDEGIDIAVGDFGVDGNLTAMIRGQAGAGTRVAASG